MEDADRLRVDLEDFRVRRISSSTATLASG